MKYRILRQDEIIRKGDEWLPTRWRTWIECCLIGTTVDGLKVRRKLKPVKKRKSK